MGVTPARGGERVEGGHWPVLPGIRETADSWHANTGMCVSGARVIIVYHSVLYSEEKRTAGSHGPQAGQMADEGGLEKSD